MAHYKTMMDSPYIGAHSPELVDEPVYTIAKVVKEEITAEGGKKSTKPVAHFVEKDVLPLVINTTNAKIITAMYGSPDTDDWVGKTVKLFIKEGVRYADGTFGPAVRLRNTANAKSTATRTQTSLEKKAKKDISSKDKASWDALVEWVKGAKGSIEKAEANYNMSPADLQILKDATNE